MSTECDSVLIPQYQSWFEALQRASQDNFFVLDVPSGFTLVHCNDAMMRATGAARDDMLGLTAPEVLGQAAGRAVEENYRRCVNSRAPVQYEEEVVDRSGEIQCWHTQIMPVIENGVVTQLIGIARNVTELRRAQQSGASKLGILAGVAQVFREHLGALKTGLPVLEGTVQAAPAEGAAPADSPSPLRDVKRALTAIDQLCKDIEDYVTLEGCQFTYVAKPLSVRALVEEVWRGLLLEAQELSVVFHYIVEEEVPRFDLLGDGERVKQILTCVVGHALQFAARAGGGIVDVLVHSVRRGMGDMYDIRFKVMDNGPGMTNAQIAELFEPFSRMQRTARRGAPATGLYIADQLTRQLGGTITVLSATGGGSEFEISVPMAAGPAAAKADGRNVLLVDDDHISAFVAKEMLEQVSWTVTTVDDGYAAVAIAAQQHFDVILMDIRMQGLDGISATRQIRDMGITTPIIAYTADVMKENCERCLAVGMNEILTKPIRRQTLLDRVEYWAARKGPPAVT